MGKHKDDLKEAGWVIVRESPSSTVFSSTLPDKVEKAMKASTSSGVLSSGTIVVSGSSFIGVGKLFVKTNAQGRRQATTTSSIKKHQKKTPRVTDKSA